MTLRKTTIDNSVKYIPQTEQFQERNIKPNTIKNISFPKKHNKKLHKTIKITLKTIREKDYKIIKGIMNCYFNLEYILIR